MEELVIWKMRVNATNQCKICHLGVQKVFAGLHIKMNKLGVKSCHHKVVEFIIKLIAEFCHENFEVVLALCS